MQLDHFGMYPERAFMKVAGRMTFEGGGGKGSSPPPAPDYVGAANATAAGNREAAIAAQEGNMINQYTPYGSVTYTQRGTSSSGTPLWSQNVSLSPEQQVAYNRDVAMNAQLQNVASQGVGYVQSALAQPLTIPGVYNPSGQTVFNPQYQNVVPTQQNNLLSGNASFSTTEPTAGLKPGVTQSMVDNSTIEKMPLYDWPQTAPASSETPTTITTSGSYTPSYAMQGVAPTRFVSNINTPNLKTEVGEAGYIQRALSQPTVDLATGAQAGPMQIGVNTYSDVARGIMPGGVINQGVYQNMGQIQTGTGANQIAGGFNYNPEVQKNIASAGDIQEGVSAPSIGITGRLDNAGSLAYGSPQNAGQIRTNVQDPTLVQQQVTDALYKQQANILDPQFARSQARLENQLANQGITRGSEAWNTAMQEANLQKQQAYESARQSAIGQGVSAAQGLYSSQLAGMGAANQALGQQFGQGVTAAQLQNQAVGQQFGQNLSAAQLQNAANAQQLQNALASGQFANQAQAQQFAQNQAAQQAYNQALGQQFSQGQSNQQLANQAAAQNNALAQANAAFANQALGQQFSQGIQGQQAQNAAQAQQFAQNQAQQQAYNQALAQQFSQGLQGAQFANTAQQQAYQQNLANAQMQNQARAQQLQEALAKGEFTNQAQAQAYQQELSRLQAENQALSQQFGFGLTNAELANQAANQSFAQGLTNAQLYNQALQQNFGIAQTLRQEPINILNAVRTGSQMQSAAMPQVGVSQPGQLATWSGPDYLGAATATGQYNQGLYNAQQASSSNQMGGLMSLGGTAMMAGAVY